MPNPKRPAGSRPKASASSASPSGNRPAPQKGARPAPPKGKRQNAPGRGPAPPSGTMLKKAEKLVEKRQRYKQFQHQATANPDLSESWKTRELEVLAHNEVVRDISSTSLDPTTTAVSNIWTCMISTIIAKIDSCFPGVLTSTSVTGSGAQLTSVSPADLAMYLYYMINQYFADVGVNPAFAATNFGGDRSGLEFNIPLQLALAIRYLAPYKKDGFVYRSVTANTAVIAVGANSAIQLAGAGACIGIFPTVGKNSAQVPATVGENNGAVGAAGLTFAQMRTYAAGISQILDSLCFTVRLADVPKLAPDASAYATVTDSGAGGASQVLSSVPDYDSEVSFLLGDLATGTGPWTGSYLSPIPPVYFTEITSINANISPTPTTTGNRRINMAASWVEALWKTNPAAVVGKLDRPIKWFLTHSDYGVLKSFIIIPRQVNLALWHAYGASLARGAKSGLSRDSLMATMMVLDCVLAAKLGEFNLWGRTADAAYYAYERSFLNFSVPLHAKHFLESIGPVIRGGRLQIPVLQFTGGDFWLSLQSTALRSNAVNTFPFQGMCNDSTGTAFSTTINGQTLTVVGGYSSGALYPVTPIVFAQGFRAIWNDVTSTWGSGGSANLTSNILALYPLDSISLLGDILNHTQVAVVVAGSTVSGDNATNGFSPKDVSINGIVSHTRLSRIDTARIFLTGYYDYLPASVGPFNIKGVAYASRVPGGSRPVSAWIDGDTSTFAREAATSVVSRKTGGIKTVDGVTVDETASNPLLLALAPVIAMTAASVIPAAINFIGDKIRPKAPQMQYAPFGSAPEKVADLRSEGERRYNEMRHYYETYKGSGAAGLASTVASNAMGLPAGSLRF